MTALLEVRNLTREYGGRPALRQLSFTLAKGEILALLGPNGSGKSTLLKALSGVLPARGSDHASGSAFFEGEDLFAFPQAWRARRVAYLGADMSAQFPITAEQAVLLGRSLAPGGLLDLASSADRTAVREAMQECLCWELRARLLESLSGGERQLVALARAFVQGSRVLLLDEALSRMDLNHQAAMGAVLNRRARAGQAFILVSHDLNLGSEWAESALLLKAGEGVATGPIHEVLIEKNLKVLYPGANLVVGESPATGAPKVFFGGKKR